MLYSIATSQVLQKEHRETLQTQTGAKFKGEMGEGEGREAELSLV